MKLFVFAFLAIFALSSGCARKQHAWQGPDQAVRVEVSPWVSREAPASVVKSPRYWVYTTLPAGPQRDALPQVLEGAYVQYQALAPARPIDDRPMHGYVFARRQEWAEFTTRKTGGDAAMYKQNTRGGYTIDDWFVAYALDDLATFSVAAHEGFHQYAARHFKSRLPPFLEEGLACLFETVRMEDGLPRWNATVNPGRAYALFAATKENRLIPLEQLAAMHAGDVVDQAQPKIDAFYAQSWGFARFLLEAEGGRYRPMLQKLLADTAAGTVYDPGGTLRAPHMAWDPSGTKAVLEHYLGQDLATIDRAYRVFVTQVTRKSPPRVR